MSTCNVLLYINTYKAPNPVLRCRNLFHSVHCQVDLSMLALSVDTAKVFVVLSGYFIGVSAVMGAITLFRPRRTTAVTSA